MALILTQNQQDCMSDAVKILEPADVKQCELEVELCLIFLTHVFSDPPRGNPTKARKQLKALNSCVARYTELMDSLDPAAEGVLPDDLDRLREAQELLAKATPRLRSAAKALPPRNQGDKVNWHQRMLASFCLDLFENYKPGEAKATSGQFPEFVELMYSATTDLEAKRDKLVRSTRWACNQLSENDRRNPDLCDADA